MRKARCLSAQNSAGTPFYGGGTMADVILLPLEPEDREQFILDDQEAFNYGALVEFDLAAIILRTRAR